MSTKSAALLTAIITAKKTHFLNGFLEVLDASNNVLVSFTLSATAGSVAGPVWTLGFVATAVDATGAGVAASVRLKTSGGTVAWDGFTVGGSASGAEFKLSNTNIAIGQTITVTSAAITQS